MKIAIPTTAAALALVMAAATAFAQTALAPAAPAIGAKVRDDKGKAIGEVVKVVNGPDGKPRQVMVKVDRVLRTLPIDSLSRQGDAYVSVLSRAEVASLPPSD